jgi:hypothetical protein
MVQNAQKLDNIFFVFNSPQSEFDKTLIFGDLPKEVFFLTHPLW